MAIRFKKTYKFAVKSALYVTFFTLATFGLFSYFFYKFHIGISLLFGLFVFVFAFFVIQYRVEHFIYRRVKKIYDDVSLLEQSSLRNQPITTDMATLTREVKKFAMDKKLEIEALKIREEYRREFLGNVSHELKTPLFMVQGYLSTLLDGAMKDKNLLKKYLERAEHGVERLIFIVKDLDMITKLETGDVHLEYAYFDLVELTKRVFELLEMKAQKKNISLDLESKNSVKVYADQEKIQQVLTNLVENSIKYGKVGGTTEVTIESLTKNKVIVRVTDNGEGIEKNMIPRLFERFFRVDKSGARSEGGSGLGLAIVKHIIEAHNEKIYVESQIGVGSEFSFTLEKMKNN